MGYQVKACSKVFCLGENPPLRVAVCTGVREGIFVMSSLPVPATTSTATRLTSTWIAKLTRA